MSETTKTITIGIFIIASIAFLAWILLFLKPTVGDGKQIISVRFSSIDKISIGTRVTYAGKPIGEVIAVSEIFESEQDLPNLQKFKNIPESEKGKLYIYELKLAVDSKVTIYSTDEFKVKTSGLFGEKAIAIIPKPRKSGRSAKIVHGDIIYAQSTDALEGTVDQVYALSSKMGKALDLIIEMIESNEENSESFTLSFKKMTNNLSSLLEEMNSSDLIDKFSKAAQGLESLTTQSSTLLKGLNENHFAENLSSITQHTNSILESIDDPESLKTILGNIKVFSNQLSSLNQSFEELAKVGANFQKTSELAYTIMNNIHKGKGSLGRIVSSDGFYLNLESVLNKAQVLMNDINHYGLLFHHDKNWQRERAKRINFLTSLETPKEFQNYFEEEVGSIETSFSRISTVLSKVQGNSMKSVAQKNDFQKGFADLLRQVKTLLGQLEEFNQEAIQAD